MRTISNFLIEFCGRSLIGVIILGVLIILVILIPLVYYIIEKIQKRKYNKGDNDRYF